MFSKTNKNYYLFWITPFDIILSFKNNQLERDIEYTFKKTPDKYNIFENIGKEIVHLFNCEKVKKEYENLSSEIKKEIKSDIVETIKIKGKIWKYLI